MKIKSVQDLAGKLDAISQLPDSDMAAHGLCIRQAAKKAKIVLATLSDIDEALRSGYFVRDHDTVSKVKQLMKLLEDLL